MRHLPEQFRRFEPLWETSAFSFESANHMLTRAACGTVKAASIIVRKFLSNHALLLDSCEAPVLESKVYTVSRREGKT